MRKLINRLPSTNMKLFNTLLGKRESDLKLTKDVSGEWVVKKGSSVLYIGPKEKCQVYLSNAI